MTDAAEKIISDAINVQMFIKDNFIARYLSATGAKIQDTVLIEQISDDGLTRKYWCEPKSIADSRPHLARGSDD